MLSVAEGQPGHFRAARCPSPGQRPSRSGPQAQAGVLKDVGALAPENVALRDAHGRVLAADLAALRTQPPAAVSAMDRYAGLSADVASAPARLRLIGEVAAGDPFDSSLGPRE